jgi:type VI secretion system protein ImpH
MTNRPLNQELFDEPYRFEFFQAVRLFAKLFPARKSVGGDALPHEESVRFRSRITLDFPSSEIHELRRTVDEGTDEERIEMLVNFMGVVGVSGVLPGHYTELVQDRIRYRDTAMWAFLDIFTHRSVSLFFRAWAKYRFPIDYEQGNDDFTSYLFDFAGLGTGGLRGRMALEDESLLPYTGLIAQKPHSTNALENILSDYFGIKAKVQQFFGQWLELSSDDQTLLGVSNGALGHSSIVGSRIWDQPSKFRLRLGPLKLPQYVAFLPDGSAYHPLESIVRLIVGYEFDFDVQLILEKKQVPAAILTTRAKRRPMLGWTSFLKTQPFESDDEQLVLQMATG